MKKWLLVLGMITCMLGASACSKQQDMAAAQPNAQETEGMIAFGEQFIAQIHQITTNNMREQMGLTDPISVGILDNWEAALTEIGDYVKVIESTVTVGEEEIIINSLIEGAARNANVQLIMDREGAIKSLTVNPIYTMVELMEKAALNTLLGMGTVFVILILISLVISCFSLIPKWQAKKSKAANKADSRNEQPKPVAAVAEQTISQIVEKEELADDSELVAVIAAAIAASEGHTSVEGFVVRSIRRARRA